MALIRLLPMVSIALLAMMLALTFLAAGDTLGYDFRAYYSAATRVMHGQPLYDASATVAGPYGVFLYPPPFVLAILPFALLSVQAATWAWMGLLVTAFGLGTAVMPTTRKVRCVIVLLAGLSWPFLYAMKLGQVGAVLYLLFAVGWRWLDVPAGVGLAGSVGALVKVQPGILLVWALLTRRWRTVALGTGVLVVAALAAAAVLGVGAWTDFLTLLARVSDPITTPHNFTLGAVAYQAGLSRDSAAALQTASTVIVVLIVVASALRLPATASYMAALVASQLVSPILWDHYAMLLLVPVAWLLSRGWWWAALIPLATSVVLVGSIPPVVYPAAFWITLVAVLAAARQHEDPSQAA